jgi:cell division protein FtsW (lipid II flippase)
MMKESAKEQFKWKFWYNAVILNGVIFFIALGIIAVFIFPDEWRVPVSAVSFLIALVFVFFFRKQYVNTKQWLEQQS